MRSYLESSLLGGMLCTKKMEEQMTMEFNSDGEDPPEQTITISTDDGILDIDTDWLLHKTTLAQKYLGKDQSVIAVRVVNDATMSQMHNKHLGEDSTTDVLTFDQGGSDDSIDADIVICSDVAIRAADERGHTMNEELLLYIVHGMLHCIGFDDHDENSHRAMHEEEDKILLAIGVGEIWSRRS